MALNPIAYTEKVVDGFLRYQLTAYPLADRNLYAQMRKLLSLEETRRTPLLRGPYLKLSAAFRQGASVKELADRGVLHPHMQRLVPHPHVYAHQQRAIEAIQAGHTTLVSTGTGSGKTECFLYPIISRCLQLRDDAAPPGIAAVLVYPMNALAEDQLERLRELLAGTGVTFGMYVGKTPSRRSDVQGERLPVGASREDYRKAMKRAADEGRQVAIHPAEERCSREEMRAKGGQPRILLTNVKELELLLTRQTDQELFAGARLDVLVFDEAHTFTGAIGGETACLIRRLRSYCGRGTEDTVCVATSATIADTKRGPEAGREFAARFFGVEGTGVKLVGEEYEPDVWADVRTMPAAPTVTPQAALRAVLEAIGTDGSSPTTIAAAYQSLCGVGLGGGADWEAALFDALACNALVFEIANELSRPRALGDLLEALEKKLGRRVSEEEVLAWLTLGAAARREGRPLVRPVVHGFVKGIGGAVVTFPRPDEGPELHLAKPIPDENNPLVALPVLACKTCGQHYFEHFVGDFQFSADRPGGGEPVAGTRLWPPQAKEEGVRVLLFDHLANGEDEDDEEDDEETTRAARPKARKSKRKVRFAELHLCRHCGALHETASASCGACGRPAKPVTLNAVRQKDDAPGVLTRCVSCGGQGVSQGPRVREPARPIRAVNVADVHVLAQEMLQHSERPRLLVFADSRQDAAFQAGWMRDHARRFRLRALMWERLRTGPVSVGDLAAHLDELMGADRDLSRTLVPEVWAEAPPEEEGRRHEDQRRFLLRTVVLREITTGVKQRIGLEPWGRMRIDYTGLVPTLPFVERWAQKLGADPTVMTEGIAAVVDQVRRRMAVYDSVHGFLSKLWEDGSTPIQRGYFPQMPGVPRGVKLQRELEDKPSRVIQFRGERGDSFVKQAARAFGVPTDDVDGFIEELWTLLTSELALLVPVTLAVSSGRPLRGAFGVFQLDAGKMRLVPHSGTFRCNKCRRGFVRVGPNDRCLAWRCDGLLRLEPENPDDYDLRLMDGNVRMVRAREHSAQVPAAAREAIEHAFKKEDSDTINTLVCTPTLEMGVDIGALDVVLMRNVPPRSANYWQRAGRAGRRHRMAVNVTYARPTSHDQAYFEQPLKLLEGRVDPPRFNLRNAQMVAKHVHATVLTRLQRLADDESNLAQSERDLVIDAIANAFPQHIKTYLFDERAEVRGTNYDLANLRAILGRHEQAILADLGSVFDAGWPAADAAVTNTDALRLCLHEMPDRLDKVIRLLRRKLHWALGEMRRLDEIRRKLGTFDDREDQEQYRRCERIVKRLKGVDERRRGEAEGYDDTLTLAVLAAQGFLPGYGLDAGAIIGSAEARMEFEADRGLSLPRPPSVALREFSPGTLLYAHGHRFTPRSFHLEPEDQPVRFQVDTTAGSIVEKRGEGHAAATDIAALGAAELRAVPICDVDLAYRSPISDDEEYRFQPPIDVYGYKRGQHDGGRAYQWGGLDVHLLRAQRLRIVNVGATRIIHDGKEPSKALGYPLCTRCGQARSPFASTVELQKFEEHHAQRCGKKAERIGFYADIVADSLSFQATNKVEAYSVAEALRAGAARVLDMELDDLHLLVIAKAGSEEVEALLYDPMPGGSGLLDQLCLRFDEVVAQAQAICEGCPSSCERSCIDCMQTFRNAFYHRQLDRNVVVDRIGTWGTALREAHAIPPHHPSSRPQENARPTNDAEQRLALMLRKAGFQSAKMQHEIELPPPHRGTVVDFFYPSSDDLFPGVCVYLDGLSKGLHGSAEAQQRDREIRAILEAKEYEVIAIAATELDDRNAMTTHFRTLARKLGERDRVRSVGSDTSWFEADAGDKVVPFVRAEREEPGRTVPLRSLKAAAGAFGVGASVEFDAWVVPKTTRTIREGMFVAKVTGKSMEPTIPDGAYCLFIAPVGDPQGMIVLAELRHTADPEDGGAYTVKKLSNVGGKVTLVPANGAFAAMELAEEDGVRVVAELVEVLG